jgi:uncharacterized protein (TIGR00725 family)
LEKEKMTGKIIGVFGAGNVREGSPPYVAAREIGGLVASRGHIVLTGGLGGVMEAASRGAMEKGGTTIGILPGDRQTTPANKYIDLAVYTGMGEARNVINVKSCDAAIAIGGEYGTLSEIALALKSGCPLVLLFSWRIMPYGDRETLPTAIPASSAQDAVDKALRNLR